MKRSSCFVSRFVSFPVFLLCLWCFCGSPLFAATTQQGGTHRSRRIDIASPAYQRLFQELITDRNFRAVELQRLFAGVRTNPEVIRLMDKHWGKPLPWYRYKSRFITAAGIREGKRYLRKYRPVFDRIERDFGVNREAVVAIWSIETNFGRNTGGFTLFRTLNTLFADYPRRSDFFRNELIEFLLLCRAGNIDPKSVKGSYAGAFGQAQFMPSSYNRYAIDYDGDGRADLLSSRSDVFASIANYLRNYGWRLDRPTFLPIGRKLASPRLLAASKEGWKGRIDWQSVVRAQKISLPEPMVRGAGNQTGGQLTLVPLDLDPKKGGGTLYIVGYPNFQAVLYYNHSQKYATVVCTLAQEFASP